MKFVAQVSSSTSRVVQPCGSSSSDVNKNANKTTPAAAAAAVTAISTTATAANSKIGYRAD